MLKKEIPILSSLHGSGLVYVLTVFLKENPVKAFSDVACLGLFNLSVEFLLTSPARFSSLSNQNSWGMVLGPEGDPVEPFLFHTLGPLLC